MASASRSARICIARPSREAYSETFIRAHVERMPATVYELWGGLPPSCSGGRSLIGRTPFHRAARYLMRNATGLPREHFVSKAISNFLRANRVDAVLAEYGPTAASLLDACNDARVPLTAHFHGYDAHSLATLERYSQEYKRLFSEAAAVIGVSRDMVAQLVALGAPPEKVHYNPCGVDLKEFPPAEPAEAPPVFVSVGRFVEKKAPHLALRAFITARAACPGARLVMFGDGPLREACMNIAVMEKLGDAVEFPGARSHEEIAAAMGRARGFVQHSVRAADGDSEGTPVALLEAAAAGLPAVATAHAGIKDVVVDGETGFLVGEGDTDAMGEAMARLAADPALAARMGSAARRTLPERYHMEQNLRALYGIVEGTFRKG